VAQIQVKGIYQDQLRDQNGGALVVDSLPAVVTQIGDLEHRRVRIVRSS
jgi:hypothetical protein